MHQRSISTPVPPTNDEALSRHHRDPEPWVWWKHGVVYQIYPRSFLDTDGDGIGDLAGITEKLPYLANLGVDAIWLSPFYPSPMVDFGYDVADYCDVDPLFGTLEDFDRLVAAAHEVGLKVIVDFVPNHTSDQHPWFAEARTSRNNPKRDWYVWRDAKPDGGLPNNWQAYFGGPMWSWDETTRQYYLHSFLPQQPDLNWHNSEVRAAMFDALRFWMARGVDGFRVDVINQVMKARSLADNPPNPVRNPRIKDMGDYAAQLHVNDQGHADLKYLIQEFRSVVDDYPGGERVVVGEIHEDDLGVWASYYGENGGGLHLPFNFGLLESSRAHWQPDELRAHVAGIESASVGKGWPNYVLGNHDEHRVSTRVGEAQARVAMMMLLTLRGTPTLYYGDEIGMVNVPISPELARDPWGLRVPGMELGRDPERTPMQWTPGRNAGFTYGPEPWLPLATDCATVNVEKESSDPRSMLSLTRALLRMRRREPALHRGSYDPIEVDKDGCFAFVRAYGQRRFLVALNMRSSTVVLRLPGRGSGAVALSTVASESVGRLVDCSAINLQPDEGLVISLAEITSSR